MVARDQCAGRNRCALGSCRVFIAIFMMAVWGMLLCSISCSKGAAAYKKAAIPRKSVTVSSEGGQIISPAQQDTLCAIARRSIAHFLHFGKEVPLPSLYDAALNMRRGCTIKLIVDNQTRGTSGYILPIKQLAAGVAEMAVRASMGNTKEGPLTLEEMDSTIIEIAVVGDPRSIVAPSEIQLGVHGLIILRGAGVGGILLPGEAGQMVHPDSAIAELLRVSRTSREDWENKKVEIQAFTMQVFREVKQ
ncbi:MAG: AMMECR1 family protein [Chitinispirillaceae bacterium]|nr:AMMECR1 family protein [Chitinispirillaceae bacterium]